MEAGPAPEIDTEHGVIAAPVYTVVVTEHVTVAAVRALLMLKVTESDDGSRFESPAYE